MSEKVQIELTVEQAQAVNAWIRNNQGIVQNVESLKKLEDASAKATKTAQDGFGPLAGLIKGMLDPMARVNDLIQIFRKEVEEVQRLNKEAAGFQLKIGPATRKVHDMLGPGSNLTPESLKNLIENSSTLDRPLLMTAIHSAMKEQGPDSDRRRAAETAIAVGELVPHEEGNIPAIAGGAMDLQKQNPNLTPWQAAAEMVRLGREHSESDAGQIADKLVPAVGRFKDFFGGKANKGTAEAFYRTVQDSMNTDDVGTAVSVGEKFIKDLTTKGAAAGLFKEGASFDEVMQAVHADTGAAKKFRDTFTVKNAAAYPTLTALLNPASKATQELFSTPMALTPAEVEAAERERAARGEAATPVYTVGRNLGAGNQDAENDPNLGMAGLSKDFYETLANSGMSWAKRLAISSSHGLDQFLNPKTKEQEVEFQLRELRRREAILRNPLSATPGMNPFANIETLERLPQLLKDRADAVDRQADLLEKILEKLSNPPPRPLPANQAALPVPLGPLNDPGRGL